MAEYERPDLRRSLWQLANSLVPYLALCCIMYFTLSLSYWLTLSMAPLAAAFLVRVFIISHDCGHGSFFRSRKGSNIVGRIASTMAFTPFGDWNHQHAVHHATAGDLDNRGVGAIWTLTVSEYRAASIWKRFSYRIYRNPLILFVIGPLFYLLILYRFPRRGVALALIIFVASVTIGLNSYLMIQLPIILLAGTAGAWLFYVQHQFEGVYWEPAAQWDYLTQATEGSSFYELPKILHWRSAIESNPCFEEERRSPCSRASVP